MTDTIYTTPSSARKTGQSVYTKNVGRMGSLQDQGLGISDPLFLEDVNIPSSTAVSLACCRCYAGCLFMVAMQQRNATADGGLPVSRAN